MKTKVFYFALAVVAAAIASSCVKEQMDPQDKPGVEITGQVFEAVGELPELGNSGQKPAQMPVAKSTLNESLTPTWVEGDKIFVSGANGDAVCTFVEGNKFQTEENVKVASPFYAIYPAKEGHSVDRETGIFTATVPSLQKIDKNQNVAAGALVAVAQSETAELQFKNAVGLVKINIGRSDIMAVKIEALGENEFVAGTFTMDLNPEDGKEPVISLVEGTGVKSVTLNTVQNYGMFEPGEYYATVLPCNLSGIRVTFTRKTFVYNEDGSVASTGSDTKSVQKQSTTVIKRNAGTDLGGFFVYEISTAEELLAWNKQVSKWTVWDVVTLKNDIDCKGVITSEKWTPNQFSGVFNGNGKTIDNFVIEKDGTAAFFKKLEGATVKDLTFGEGCSFSATAPASNNILYVSSLSGEVRQGTSIINVVNKGTVSISADAQSGSSGDYLGGICAYFVADKHGYMTGCKNYGTLTYSAASKGPVYCGGVAGLLATTVGLTLDGCENYGDVQFAGTNTLTKDINLGGITGIANAADFVSCKNLGSVLVNAKDTNSGVLNVGGIVGLINNALGTVKNCENGSVSDQTAGAIINNSISSAVVRIGGFAGDIMSKPSSIVRPEEGNMTAFKNYGPITNNGTSTTWTAVGGVVGYVGYTGAANEISGCENHGQILNTKVGTGRVTVGGVIGFIQTADTQVKTCYNHGLVKNTGNANSAVTVAGVVGRIEGRTSGTNTVASCDNRGDVLFDAASKSDGLLSGVAGILGGHTSDATITINKCNNYGDVKKSGAASGELYVGGIAGFLYGATTAVANVTYCTNEEGVDVINESTGSGAFNTGIGGVVGYKRAGGEFNECYNKGTVINKLANTGTFDQLRIGGILGYSECTKMTNCTNYGDVSDQSTSIQGCVGGVVGCVKYAITITNCDNTAKVSGLFNNSNTGTLIGVGGIVGVATKALSMSLCDNSGDVSQSDTSIGTEAVGGVAGYVVNEKNTITSCSSDAAITTASGSNKYAGAFIGRLHKAESVVQSSHISGSFNGYTFNATDYVNYCFGKSSDYKTTTGISFGTAN